MPITHQQLAGIRNALLSAKDKLWVAVDSAGVLSDAEQTLLLDHGGVLGALDGALDDLRKLLGGEV